MAMAIVCATHEDIEATYASLDAYLNVVDIEVFFAGNASEEVTRALLARLPGPARECVHPIHIDSTDPVREWCHANGSSCVILSHALLACEEWTAFLVELLQSRASDVVFSHEGADSIAGVTYGDAHVSEFSFISLEAGRTFTTHEVIPHCRETRNSTSSARKFVFTSLSVNQDQRGDDESPVQKDRMASLLMRGEDESVVDGFYDAPSFPSPSTSMATAVVSALEKHVSRLKRVEEGLLACHELEQSASEPRRSAEPTDDAWLMESRKIQEMQEQEYMESLLADMKREREEAREAEEKKQERAKRRRVGPGPDDCTGGATYARIRDGERATEAGSSGTAIAASHSSARDAVHVRYDDQGHYEECGAQLDVQELRKARLAHFAPALKLADGV